MLRGSRIGLLFAFVSACARDPLPSVERHPACFDLVPIGTALEREPVRSVRTLLPIEPSEPYQTGDWIVTAASHRLEAVNDHDVARKTLVLASDGQASVRILGPFQQEDLTRSRSVPAAPEPSISVPDRGTNGAMKRSAGTRSGATASG
jgi:hypothetical protein